jgi:hypothetical protein
MRYALRFHAPRLVWAGALLGGGAFALGFLYSTASANPFVQWMPPLCLGLVLLGGLFLVLGVVAYVVTGERFNGWWTDR